MVSMMKPTYVPLVLEILVYIEPDHYKREVARKVYEEFSNKGLSNGSIGFFHPDNLSVGKRVYLSEIISRGLTIEGLKSLKILTFNNLNDSETDMGPQNEIKVNWNEIVRLDNDPNSPENGVLIVEAHRGK